MFSFRRQRTKAPKSHRVPARRRSFVERLERRDLLTTFHVTTLNDHGAGSLRQAIFDANFHLGADRIEFQVAGTISLTTGALPTISGRLDIDGTSAPGYAGSPVVAVDFNNFGGLKFNTFADGSQLRGLSLVDAAHNAVTLVRASDMQITGNFIGVGLDGSTVIANRGNGIELFEANRTLIGGPNASDCNVISGNRDSGIRLNDSKYNDILGNCIGTDDTGTFDLGNRDSGIVLTDGSIRNRVGVGAGNVISGNEEYGILMNGGAGQTMISGNKIGVDMSGTSALGNGLDGIRLENTEQNLIGNSQAVESVDYFYAGDGQDIQQPVNGWQGITAWENPNEYMLTGSSLQAGLSNALLYIGSIDGNSGNSYFVNYPSAQESSIYGAESLGGGVFRVVGTYKTANPGAVAVNGYVFEGTIADIGNPSNYRTINHPGAKYNYLHSTMGGLVVGNFDNPAHYGEAGVPFGRAHAFVYNLATEEFTEIIFPGAKSNTAYSIWHNGGTSYTIAGGYGLGILNNFDNQLLPIGQAYLVDYDSATGEFTHWENYKYPDGLSIVTHFQGVSGVEEGAYTVAADSAQLFAGTLFKASWVTIRRKADGSFGEAEWYDIRLPDQNGGTYITSADSVYANQVVGSTLFGGSYQATVNVEFQLSNVISANGGSGISLDNADSTLIQMNFVGTDITGMIDLGNAKHGILLDDGSSRNLIGGEVTGGNDPIDDTFVQPPQGNVISGNGRTGVSILDGSTNNQLSGNFIGTDVTGNSALGNDGDGVAIVDSDNNSLLGCRFQQNPFVFYNVVSGNGGNGLRVEDSNYTKIQANFFGMGADNNTAVGNALNGVLVEGTSHHVALGGPLPLGNVVVANGMNGVYVRDEVSFFTAYNTFAGQAAFTNIPGFGNQEDGIKITATGGAILIRTNVIGDNGDDGIEISGRATGVRVAGNMIGLNVNGTAAAGNGDNGVEIRGRAHDIVIGGEQPTFNLIPQNAISSNAGNGVAILGSANDIRVNHSFIGLDIFGLVAMGNGASGVYIGPGTFDNVIGSAYDELKTIISSNLGHGIQMEGTHDNRVLGTYIGTDRDGLLPRGNGGNGVLIVDSSDNLIGSATDDEPGNIIAFSANHGVHVISGERNAILHNSIHTNNAIGIALNAGANDDQAAPFLTDAHIIGTDVPVGTQVKGMLTSKPKSTYTIEFFANFTSSEEGHFYLGSMTVKTNKNGVAKFAFIGTLPPTGATYITATATDAFGNTSEFSLPIQIDHHDFVPGIYLYYPGEGLSSSV